MSWVYAAQLNAAYKVVTRPVLLANSLPVTDTTKKPQHQNPK